MFFSLCTTLCLQWEAEIIAVSLMYLASRLSKFDIQDWEGKPPGSRMKWWEWFVEGITMELMEGKLAFGPLFTSDDDDANKSWLTFKDIFIFLSLESF